MRTTPLERDPVARIAFGPDGAFRAQREDPYVAFALERPMPPRVRLHAAVRVGALLVMLGLVTIGAVPGMNLFGAPGAVWVNILSVAIIFAYFQRHRGYAKRIGEILLSSLLETEATSLTATITRGDRERLRDWMVVPLRGAEAGARLFAEGLRTNLSLRWADRILFLAAWAPIQAIAIMLHARNTHTDHWFVGAGVSLILGLLAQRQTEVAVRLFTARTHLHSSVLVFGASLGMSEEMKAFQRRQRNTGAMKTGDWFAWILGLGLSLAIPLLCTEAAGDFAQGRTAGAALFGGLALLGLAGFVASLKLIRRSAILVTNRQIDRIVEVLERCWPAMIERAKERDES